MDEKEDCLASRQQAMYADLESKAALDADATVSLIEALEAVYAGKDAGEALARAGLTAAGAVFPGRSPLELARETIALSRLQAGSAGMRRIAALRDSLYRYQSFIQSRIG